jgi:hypothetical protein
MQSQMSLRQSVMRWALRLIMRHGNSAAKVRTIITSRFREFASDNRIPNAGQTLSENLHFSNEVDHDLRIPSGHAVPAPEDVVHLLPPHTRPLAVHMKHVTIQGRQYSTSDSSTTGNSHIMYVPKLGLLPIPGRIKYLLYIDGTHYIAVNRITRVPHHRWNIFRAYLDYPATVAQSVLGVLDLIPALSEYVRGHYAKLILSDEYDLLIDLSRVSPGTSTSRIILTNQ